MKADLERKRSTFFLVGLVVALGFVFMAFEWNSPPKKAEFSGGTRVVVIEDVMTPLIREPKVKPPQVPKPKVADVINVIEDFKDAGDLDIDFPDPGDYVAVELPVFIETPQKEPEEKIYVNTVDEPAEFPGGERALYKYISEHVKYPVVAQEIGIQGKVYVNFVVDESGNAVDIRIGRSADPSLDAEALRVISSLPRFKPGRQAGKAVKVYYTAVINFQLR